MNGKLKVLVRLNLDGSQACIKVKGTVTTANIQALYSLARRANSLAGGLRVTVDLTAAGAGQDVLAGLAECVRTRRLPATVDPAGTECRLQVLAPADTPDVALAA